MNLPNQLHKSFHTLWLYSQLFNFSPPSFTFFAFLLPSYNPFLNVAEWVFGHNKSHIQQDDLQMHETLLGYFNDDAHAIVVDMVQGWIREVNQCFGRASRGERLGESYI